MSALLRQSGFTLLEMVIAMGLLAIGLLGLSIMTSSVMSQNMKAHQRVVAMQLARNKLENLGSGDYSNISDSMEMSLDSSGVSGSGVFRREVVVVERTKPVRKEVTATVSWEAKGAHQVVLKTIFAP